MSSIAKSSISLSKKDLTKSRKTLIASRNIVFYHKTVGGETTIDLNNLSMPSEMPTQVQATAEEISSARLAIFKKNLKLVSSANGELIQGLDYLVLDSYTISLIGPYQTIGAEAAEIFIGTVVGSPMSDLTVVSTRDIVKTYVLPIGQTTLNLGQEYQIGTNTLENIGSMKVWVNGVLALRGQDYIEVEAGDTGYGSTIEFLSAPVGIDWQIVVDFGVRAITDTDAMGTIESLSGSVKRIADDLAVVAGTSANDYLTANPSEIERRTFGDMVLDFLGRIAGLELITREAFSSYSSPNISNTHGATITLTLNNHVDGTNNSGTDGDGWFHEITVAGLYEVIVIPVLTVVGGRSYHFQSIVNRNSNVFIVGNMLITSPYTGTQMLNCKRLIRCNVGDKIRIRNYQFNSAGAAENITVEALFRRVGK